VLPGCAKNRKPLAGCAVALCHQLSFSLNVTDAELSPTGMMMVMVSNDVRLAGWAWETEELFIVAMAIRSANTNKVPTNLAGLAPVARARKLRRFRTISLT